MNYHTEVRYKNIMSYRIQLKMIAKKSINTRETIVNSKVVYIFNLFCQRVRKRYKVSRVLVPVRMSAQPRVKKFLCQKGTSSHGVSL